MHEERNKGRGKELEGGTEETMKEGGRRGNEEEESICMAEVRKMRVDKREVQTGGKCNTSFPFIILHHHHHHQAP